MNPGESTPSDEPIYRTELINRTEPMNFTGQIVPRPRNFPDQPEL